MTLARDVGYGVRLAMCCVHRSQVARGDDDTWQ